MEECPKCRSSLLYEKATFQTLAFWRCIMCGFRKYENSVQYGKIRCRRCGKEFQYVKRTSSPKLCYECKEAAYKKHLERQKKRNKKRKTRIEIKKCLKCGREFIGYVYKAYCQECSPNIKRQFIKTNPKLAGRKK